MVCLVLLYAFNLYSLFMLINTLALIGFISDRGIDPVLIDLKKWLFLHCIINIILLIPVNKRLIHIGCGGLLAALGVFVLLSYILS